MSIPISPPPRLPGLFIAGTDTGVGKTVVGCALLRAARQRGRRLIPFKPAETGIDPEPLDALRLHAAAGAPVPAARVCLYPLRLPAAPQAAAALEGVTISIGPILDRASELAAAGDGLLVEAAGGLLVPYAPGLTGADLARYLGLPVLLVARAALGTINHTALSVAELRRRHLQIAGVLLVQTQATHEPHEETNAPLIHQLTGLAPLGILPHLPGSDPDPDALASALSQAIGSEPLDRLLTLATGASPGSRPRV
jgi:dethiobiotin synthetase